jgi:hypothetical protein
MISYKAVALVPLALIFTACALPLMAGAKPSPTPNTYQQELAYSRCMRSHGIADFPDPPSGGGAFQFQGGPGSDMNPQSSAFQAATNACKSLAPKDQGGPGSMSAADKQKLLAYSACMRSHGVPDFPDPTFSSNGGGLVINGSAGGDMDPRSPAFQAADKACRSLMPNRPGTSTQTGPGSGPNSSTNVGTGQ